MPAIPHVMRRGGAYFWRRRVPKGCPPQAANALTISLRTSDAALARRRAVTVSSIAEDVFAGRFGKMLTAKEARAVLEAACLFAENHYEKCIASGQGLVHFDMDGEKRDELAAGWAWRLVHERGRSASVTAVDQAAMVHSGLRTADIPKVERMIRMACRHLRPATDAPGGYEPGTEPKPGSDGGVLFNRDADIAEVGVMAGVEMTPSAFKHVDRLLVEAKAALAFKRAGKVPASLQKAAEIADKADPWRFRDVDDEAINRALVQGGFDPYPTPADFSTSVSPADDRKTAPLPQNAACIVNSTPTAVIAPIPETALTDQNELASPWGNSVTHKEEAVREAASADLALSQRAPAPDFSSILNDGSQTAAYLAPPPSGATLEEVLPAYFAYRGKTLKKATYASIEGSVRLLERIIGSATLRSVTRENAKHFCKVAGRVPSAYSDDSLAFDEGGNSRTLLEIMKIGQARGLPNLTLGTIIRHCSNLKGIWVWAVREQLHSPAIGNPFDLSRGDVTAYAGSAVRKSEERKAWDPVSFEKYLTGPVHMGCAGTRNRFKAGNVVIRDALYWGVPILYLCMMRRGELFQLRVKHVRPWSASNGQQRWYFDLTDPSLNLKGKAASRRQSASYRQVPIHSAIEELGFIREHVEGRDPDELLFPELKPAKQTDYGNYIGNRLREYAKELGVFEELMDTHSLRRTANSELFSQLASPVIRAQLLGHSSGGTQRIQGDAMMIQQLAEALAQAFGTHGLPAEKGSEGAASGVQLEVVNQLLGQHTMPGHRETMQEKHYLEDLPLQLRGDVVELLKLPVSIERLKDAWVNAEKRIVVRSAPPPKRKGVRRPENAGQ